MMKYVVNAMEMKHIDQYTIEKVGIPSVVLMERAAHAVVSEIMKEVPAGTLQDRLCVVLCGKGNNGADGLAAARMLHIIGMRPVVYFPGEGRGEEWRTQYQIVKNLKIPVCDLNGLEEILKEDRAGLIVDALFGIGLNRGIEGEMAQVIGMANQSRAYRATVDIPSGISADTGEVLQIAFKADLTVTFGSVKFGCLLYPGSYYCGKTVTADIGFPKEAYDFVNPRFFTRDASEAPVLLPERPANAHKGTFGRLTVIAGTYNMSGAAYLAALAAYRIGTGLVRIVTPRDNRGILQMGVPEAILTTYDREDFSLEPVMEAIHWADAIVAGPGMGINNCSKAIVRAVLQEAICPVIFDADALRIIGDSEGLEQQLKVSHVVTPHLGEMAALSGRKIQEIEEDPVMAAREFSHIYQTNCVLKGARTVVSRSVGRDYINTTGNSGMATAGSGDVLSGIIGGLMAQGMSPFDAACAGVLIHGCAGDLAAKKKGERALMASDLAEALCLIR